jgi:hypothetical protein
MTPVLNNFLMTDRVPFPDDDFDAIEPRNVPPIEPRVIAPEPSTPAPDSAAEIAQTAIITHTPELADLEHATSESDILLEAIRIVAKREPTFVNDCALRDLVRKFAHQYSLDF